MRGSIIAWLSLCATVQAGTLNIVATGDSITTGYAPIRMTLAMMSQGITGTGYSIASGGATAPIYVGDQLDIRHMPEPSFHNQAVDAINGPVYGFGAPWIYGSVIVEHPEPDAVIVMLGTNDAIQCAAGNYLAWPAYLSNMSATFAYLASAETPNGKHPEIFIATPIPILNPQYAAADAFIDSDVVPWLRDQVAYWQGQGADFHLLDIRNSIQQQPDWQFWYNDGLHLYAQDQAGYVWMASEVLNAVLDLHAGDANLDGTIDGLDYTTWADHFQQNGNWSQGDFNHDGIVDGLDYCVWADHFSDAIEQRMPIEAAYLVPEPSGLLLAGMALAGLAVVAVRRQRSAKVVLHFARS